MNLQEIRVLAKDIGIKVSNRNKSNLIQAIQLTEGNFDCFASAKSGECDQLKCKWRDDCFSAAKKLDS